MKEWQIRNQKVFEIFRTGELTIINDKEAYINYHHRTKPRIKVDVRLAFTMANYPYIDPFLEHTSGNMYYNERNYIMTEESVKKLSKIKWVGDYNTLEREYRNFRLNSLL